MSDTSSYTGAIDDRAVDNLDRGVHRLQRAQGSTGMDARSRGVRDAVNVGGGMAGNEFDRAELNALGRALNNLEPFRELRRDMPLQYVYSFLLVASRPGRTVLDYAKMAGVSHSVMSRHLLDIGPRARDMTEGFGLVEFYTEPNDMRAHYYRLTVKGKRIATQIIRNMGAH